VGAQAQRDSEEARARESALADWPSVVGAVDNGAGVTAAELVSAYRQQMSAEVIAKTLIARFHSGDAISRCQELMVILSIGDPWGSPGLTVGVEIALTHYLQRISSASATARDFAEKGVGELFDRPRAHADYWRLQPLLVVIGKVIADLGVENDRSVLGVMALKVMREVDEDVLLGPMRSWIDGFAHLVEQDTYTFEEHQGMQALGAKYPPGSEAADALSVLINASELQSQSQIG